ncbi:MAG: hypothetical protein FWC55_08035 [Firmicutes bacterium]|nr:hypothetical protein [Bacillota bacterium]
MYKNNTEVLARLAEAMKAKNPQKLNMIIGADGFVDEIVHVVDKRQDFENFTRITKIEDFGNRIARAAGLSTNLELVAALTKLGGNGPILSNALIEYGVGLTYVGALGNPNINPVFEPMAKRCKVYSLCEPGHTDAVEFTDGKVMLGKHSMLKEITWSRFMQVVGSPAEIAGMINACDLFGMENWTMIPHMSAIWRGLIDEVFPLIGGRRPIAFFDLADPEKRTKADILDALELIGKFESKFDTVLGLNEKELYEVAEVYGIAEKSGADRLAATTADVYGRLGIGCLVVHPTKEAICVAGGEYYQQDGPYCASPALTTGAGDNFNAGFCLGRALGLDPQLSLALGVSTSGYYVRNAKSPTAEALLEFVGKWAEGKI